MPEIKEAIKKRRGNPAWVKGGPSPNPMGKLNLPPGGNGSTLWKPGGPSPNPSGKPSSYMRMVEEHRAESAANLSTWIQIRDNRKAPQSARIDAAAKIHAYAWGKPVEIQKLLVADDRDPPTITVRLMPLEGERRSLPAGEGIEG